MIKFELFERDCLGRPTSAPAALWWASQIGLALRSSRSERRRDPRQHKIPDNIRIKYAGGHRIRVTPVPIPNTEVKPDTADGTARETVWESRSLPAVIQTGSPMR